MQPERLFLALADTEVVVIGGLAAVLHGSAYVTSDADLCVNPSPTNAERVARALASFRPYPRGWEPGLPFVWDGRTVRDTSILTLTTTVGDVDLLHEVPGVGSFADVRRCAEVFDLGEVSVRVLDLDALIVSKRAAGRPKDLALIPDLEALRALGESGG